MRRAFRLVGSFFYEWFILRVEMVELKLKQENIVIVVCCASYDICNNYLPALAWMTD